MRATIRYGVGLLFLITQGPVLAQNGALLWSEPMVVAQGTQDLMRPRVVLNADHQPIVIWGENNSNRSAVLQGEAFSTPQMIHPAGIQVASADWQGSELASMGDAIYAALKRTPEATQGVYLISSMDGGLTWGDTLRVDQIPGYKSRFSSVAVNGDGEPLVQYMRIDMQETDHRYMVTRVVDGVPQLPEDVSSPFTDGEDCDCCPGRILANGDDAVALFRDATDNVRVIWGAFSNDGGGTFTEGAQLDPTGWILNACPASGPDGVIIGDSIRYTWMSGAINGTKIHLGSAGVDGTIAGTPVPVHPGEPQNLQQNHPQIAGSGDTLGVVWQQSYMTQTEIIFAWSTSGIHGMSVPDTVNVDLAGPQRTPDIAYANGTFHIVWSDYQTNTIMYRTASIDPNIGISEKDGSNELYLWPVPANDVLNIAMDASHLQVGKLECFDARGSLVRSLPAARSISVNELPEGAYTLLLMDRMGLLVGRARFSIIR